MHAGQGRPLEQSSRAMREGAAHLWGVGIVKSRGNSQCKSSEVGVFGDNKEASIGVRVREQSAPRGPAGRGRLGCYSESGGGLWKVWGRGAGCWVGNRQKEARAEAGRRVKRSPNLT